MRGKTNQNLIRQLHRTEIDGEVDIEVDAGGEPTAPLLVSHAAGHTLVVNRAGARRQGATEILYAPEGSILDDIEDFRSGKLKANWVSPKPVKSDAKSVQEWRAHCDAVRESHLLGEDSTRQFTLYWKCKSIIRDWQTEGTFQSPIYIRPDNTEAPGKHL